MMTMMKILPVVVLLGGAALPARAQTTADMVEQAGGALQQADKAMNAAYQRLMKVLNDEGKTRLKAAQKAWLAYRDAQAGFDCHHFAGGTAENLERLGSLELLTKERTKRLDEDFKRFEEMN